MGVLLRLIVLTLCHCWAVADVGAATFRDSLLQLAHDRLEVQYADKSSLDDPKQRDDVIYQLSKDDKACGNDGVPIMFLDFEISGARPIDAFNVLADGLSQSKWDAHCDKVVEVLDERYLQARGFAATFLAKPLSSREAFEWQVVSANFSSQEFWVVFTTAGNDDLKARKALDPDAVEMQNCLGAYRLQLSAKGVHVLGTQQVNSHSSPISARTAANMAWGQTIDWAVAFRKAVQQQTQLAWNDTNTSVPDWMLEPATCEKPDPGDHVRKSVLELAETEFGGPRGEEHSSATLPNGAVLEMWRRDGLCGGDGVPRDALPAWQTDFCIAEATPVDVFNVLVAKEKEPSWNSLVSKVNITGMHAGARGVHEALRLPNTLWHKWKLRELFEWQAAGHEFENDTYVIATVSTEQRIADMFDATNNMMAFQCMSAYHLSRGKGCNGTQVRTAMHFNPNVGMVSGLAKWWPEAGRTLLLDFAEHLSDHAQTRAASRAAGGKVEVDDQALAMLAPARPNWNSSLDVRTVLAATAATHFLELLSNLDLHVALDSSTWAFGSFAERAADVQKLFERVRQNATAEEEHAFAGGVAKNTLDLQVQGEALWKIQGWVLAFLACGGGDSPHVPDINRHKHPKGLPMTALLVLLGSTVAAAALGVVCCSWCWYRRCKRQRASTARGTAIVRTGGDVLLQAEQGGTA